ncbi:Palmitoyl-protein thioesterase 1 [Stygiomarasmius scandens]|uniref:Palmitoyl-protein thioesterase 1 n=1 Tax=Marasmiellus scandens TaxID=2682957 RepID=A0ABR1JNW9_9AGAR
MSTNKKVAELKTTAGAHFKAKEYEQASQLYTEAIKLDGNNATLWFNRSMCRYNTKRYVGAVYDAKKAVELDPNYIKAWVRLGLAYDALGQPWHSVVPWTKAFSILNERQDLTPADIESREDYCRKMARSLKAMTNPPKKYSGPLAGKQRSASEPWLSAYAVKTKSEDKGELELEESCVDLVCHMYEQIQKGIEMLGPEMVDDEIDNDESKTVIHPQKSTVEQLTDALLMDTRLIPLTESSAKEDFMHKCLKQGTLILHCEAIGVIDIFSVKAEAEFVGVSSWIKTKDLDMIKRESLQLLKREGWKSSSTWGSGMSAALSTTIRAWILHGLLQSEISDEGDFAEEIKLLERVIELIKWVRGGWKFVGKNERGEVFELTYLNMVQSRYLYAIFKLVEFLDDDEPSTVASLYVKMEKTADELLESVESQSAANDLSNLERKLKLAYYDYPKGQALSMKGLYLKRHAETLEASDSEETAETEGAQDARRKEKACLNKESMQAYLDAAGCYPVDEERHTWFLYVALKRSESVDSTTFDAFFKLVERIESALGPMSKIWLGQIQDRFKVDHYNYVISRKRRVQAIMAKAGVSKEEAKEKTIDGVISDGLHHWLMGQCLAFMAGGFGRGGNDE